MSTDNADTASDNDELKAAATDLLASPRELGAWWRIAESLASLGETERAARAFADLGNSASELAAVGLAVACALRVRSCGDAKAADKLLAHIGKLHCKGSKRVDPGLSSVPPSPPLAPEPSEAKPSGELSAFKLADHAMKVAKASARDRASKELPPTPLIRFLTPGELCKLVEVMTLERYQRGDVVVDVGDSADALYWIARGSAEVSKGDRLLGELSSDAFFGEIALVGASTRTARVASLEDSDILSIPAAVVEDMAVQAPSLAKVLASHARSRLLSNIMRTSELFVRLSVEERRSLLPKFETSYADDGEHLIQAGSSNNALFVVVAGICEVRNGDEVVTTLSVGDGFGEMSMLGRKEAGFDVVASGPTILLKASRDKFDEIAMAHPELLAEVYKLLVERERENDAIIHDAEDLVI